jgi:energy-coupling factor transporter ATP-binding protein EcfA2
MAIRIDRIKVKRAGPLDKDFELEPGDLNIVYGHNETGKTYIVETMINLLFRTGSRSPAKWNLREWDLGGRIIVSGLEDDPVPLTKTGRKLEDYWEEGPGLPRDLSHLLVVKAGETILAEEEEDGVGRGILKNYLFGEGLLDKIAARISTTMQDATVQDRLIHGAQRGEVKTRIQCEERLDSLNALLNDVEEGYASGEVYSLRQKKEAIEVELDKLEKAKRYHAAQLHDQIQALRREKDGLPAEEELSELEADVRIHDSRKVEAETKSATLKALEGTSEDYRWTEKALGDYSEIISKQAVSGPKPILILLALLFFVGAVVSGFFGLNIPLVICGIGALAFFILYYMGTRNALARAGESTELENLKADFSSRFGSELTNKAVLQAKLDKLKENHIRATSLREEVNKLTLEINSHKSSITETLKVFTGAERPPQQWRDLIKGLRNSIKGLEDKIRSLDRKLLFLAVQEEEYLDKHPGAEWDAGRYDTLKQELAEIDEALHGEMTRLDQLKARVIQETRSKSTEWEGLITELRDNREQAAEEYSEITAEILAKVQVNTAIEEFREEENMRIADGLKRHELTKPLHALTGRYDSIRHEEDSGLVLVTGEDEEYSLADISTGAREQIFLALRIGFASIAMGGETAFLILDDAFQHSDWDRRKNLIAQTLSLVKTGWQVFYFAMDDHIRDLFLEAGGALGDRFRSLEL